MACGSLSLLTDIFPKFHENLLAPVVRLTNWTCSPALGVSGVQVKSVSGLSEHPAIRKGIRKMVIKGATELKMLFKGM